MARGVVVQLQGEESSFSFTKVEREKLYGRKERVIVDEKDKPCSPAWLTADGVALIPQGGAAYVYVDDKFDSVERAELKLVNEQGVALTPVPSTLGVPQTLTGPVSPQRVLDHVATAVYQLTAESLGDKLRAELAAGQIYETTFSYREGYDLSPAFLLQNDQGLFLLVSAPVPFEFLRREAMPTVESADDEENEELDFSML